MSRAGATAPTGTCEVRVGVSAETAKAWTLDAKVYTANARDNAKGAACPAAASRLASAALSSRPALLSRQRSRRELP